MYNIMAINATIHMYIDIHNIIMIDRIKFAQDLKVLQLYNCINSLYFLGCKKGRGLMEEQV